MTQKTDEVNDSADSNPESELESKLAHAEEARLRALADLENYRKRVEKEQEYLRTTANQAVLRAVAELSDDFQRSIEELKKTEEFSGAVEILGPFADKLDSVFTQFEVEKISVAPGDKLDPQTMQAIGTTPVTDQTEENKIVHVASSGYRHIKTGNVLKPAQVITGKLTKKTD